MRLSDTNAGGCVGYLRSHGVKAWMRGGDRGGSVGAAVIYERDGKRWLLEPGDEFTTVGGVVSVSSTKDLAW